MATDNGKDNLTDKYGLLTQPPPNYYEDLEFCINLAFKPLTESVETDSTRILEESCITAHQRKN